MFEMILIMEGRIRMRNILLLMAILMLSACAGAPTVQTGPDAETSFDGLTKVDNSRFRQAWANPDADWTRYTKIMSGGSELQFRAVKKTNRSALASSRSGENEFWIDEEARTRLAREVSEVFQKELAKSERFTMTDTAGDDVLVVRGELSDIVSNVPPEPMGRSNIYLRSVGEATLTVEISDSNSGEVIARVVERRAAERPGETSISSNVVSTWSEVRRLAQMWANKLRAGLDSVPTE